MTQCIGKRRWDNESAVSRALNTIRSSPEAWELKKVPVRYYLCDVCRGWHVTAMPEQGSGRKRVSRRGRRGR